MSRPRRVSRTAGRGLDATGDRWTAPVGTARSGGTVALGRRGVLLMLIVLI
jgi:hypothetical protein